MTRPGDRSDEAEPVRAEVGRALATAAGIVVAVGLLQTVLVGDFPGVARAGLHLIEAALTIGSAPPRNRLMAEATRGCYCNI